MNAYLMAAGLSTRMLPKTENYPKCLLPVAGSPILEWWLDAILKCGEFSRVFVNVHHCPKTVRSWVSKYSEMKSRTVDIISEEPKLLGTAGTLFWHGEFGEDFMVAYSDTFSRQFFERLGEYAGFWRSNPDKPVASLVTFPMPKDASCGAIELDAVGTITSFTEKSEDGVAAWAGIAFCRGDFYDHIHREDFDLARDVFPRLVGKMRFLAHVDAVDIGKSLPTYESLRSTL